MQQAVEFVRIRSDRNEDAGRKGSLSAKGGRHADRPCPLALLMFLGTSEEEGLTRLEVDGGRHGVRCGEVVDGWVR